MPAAPLISVCLKCSLWILLKRAPGVITKIFDIAALKLFFFFFLFFFEVCGWNCYHRESYLIATEGFIFWQRVKLFWTCECHSESSFVEYASKILKMVSIPSSCIAVSTQTSTQNDRWAVTFTPLYLQRLKEDKSFSIFEIWVCCHVQTSLGCMTAVTIGL